MSRSHTRAKKNLKRKAIKRQWRQFLRGRGPKPRHWGE